MTHKGVCLYSLSATEYMTRRSQTLTGGKGMKWPKCETLYLKNMHGKLHTVLISTLSTGMGDRSGMLRVVPKA